MAEPDPLDPALEPTPPRRLPAWVRHPLAVVLGVLLAVLASYMLRKIGF